MTAAQQLAQFSVLSGGGLAHLQQTHAIDDLWIHQGIGVGLHPGSSLNPAGVVSVKDGFYQGPQLLRGPAADVILVTS